jgi:hypothetical protein
MKIKLAFLILSVFAVISCSPENSNPLDICNAGGVSYDYVISEVYIPGSLTEAQANGIGMDLDDNGSIDNKLAALMKLLLDESDEFEINSIIADQIRDGGVILLNRLKIDDFTGDGEIMGTFVEGEMVGSATENLYSGDGHFTMDATSEYKTSLCGRIYGAGVMELSGSVVLNLPLTLGTVITLTVEHAQVKGQVTDAGWTDVILAGGVQLDEVIDKILPSFVDNVNDEISSNRAGSQFIIDTFDNNCSTEIEGCANNVECVSDEIITETELKCNSIVNTVLTPDVTIEGEDFISFGVRIQGVKAIIDNGDMF